MTYTDEQITELIARLRAEGAGGVVDRLTNEAAAALAQVKAERDALRKLSQRWQETINAPGFLEAVNAEALAYHEDACLYQRERDALRQVIEEVSAALALDARSSVRVAAAVEILTRALDAEKGDGDVD